MAQRSEPTLYALLTNPDEKKGYRVAVDGLLEKGVIAKDRPMTWVPVVPQGNATTHLSWKRWVWLQNKNWGFRSTQKRAEDNDSITTFGMVGDID